jgi:hypothetical protein
MWPTCPTGQRSLDVDEPSRIGTPAQVDAVALGAPDGHEHLMTHLRRAA